MYLDRVNKVCKSQLIHSAVGCTSPCADCFSNSPNACYSCIYPTYVLDNSTCLSGCPAKKYNDDGRCFACNPGCKTCERAADNCIGGCELDYLQKGSTCVTDCGPGFAPSGSRCLRKVFLRGVVCLPTCEICKFDNETHVCSHCRPDLYLFEGSCNVVCPAGTYPDIVKRICLRCASACRVCFGPSETECLQCNSVEGYIFREPSACTFPICGYGQYLDRVLKRCQRKFGRHSFWTVCGTRCATCTTRDFCTSCLQGYILEPASGRCIGCNELKGMQYKPNSYECAGRNRSKTVEICGDGRNMRFLECDDGNTRNGDGCSSTCTIEKDYRCGGGNEDKPDLCVETRKPEIKSVTIYKNLTAVLKLSEPVTMTTTTPQSTFELAIVGHLNGRIALKWDAQQFDRRAFNKLSFDLNVNVSLSGYEVHLMAL